MYIRLSLKYSRGFRCQEDSRRRYHRRGRSPTVSGTGCHSSISPFPSAAAASYPTTRRVHPRTNNLSPCRFSVEDLKERGRVKKKERERKGKEERESRKRVRSGGEERAARVASPFVGGDSQVEPETKDSAPLSLVKIRHSSGWLMK